MISSDNAEIKKKAIQASLFVSLSLSVLKIFVAFFSGAISVAASALDSVFDLLISATNFWAVQKSDAHPTKSFQYGFGKIEGVMGLFQSLLIIVSGAALGFFGVRRVLTGGEVLHFESSISVMIVATVATLFLVRFLKLRAKETGSLILESDAAHYQSDIFANVAILGSLILIFFTGEIWIDGAVSVVMAILILKEGVVILKKSVFLLLDHEVDVSLRRKIVNILLRAQKAKQITSYHFLRTRKSGSKIFVDVHLVFTEKTLLKKAHDISDAIEAEIAKVIGGGEVLIHLDPVDDSDEMNV